jgi:hypothetical protein
MPQVPNNAFTRRFLDGLPRAVADSFTPDQLDAVQRAFGMRYATEHTVDLRRAVRVFGQKFYVILLVGEERRSDAPPPRSYMPFGVAAALVSAVLLLLG